MIRNDKWKELNTKNTRIPASVWVRRRKENRKCKMQDARCNKRLQMSSCKMMSGKDNAVRVSCLVSSPIERVPSCSARMASSSSPYASNRRCQPAVACWPLDYFQGAACAPAPAWSQVQPSQAWIRSREPKPAQAQNWPR